MRSEVEIHGAYGTLRAGAMGDETMNLEGEPDSFKFGFFLGKLAALEWVLGAQAHVLSVHHDYQTYRAEVARRSDRHEESEEE